MRSIVARTGLVLFAFLLGSGCGGVADRAALEAERSDLERRLLQRQIILADLEIFKAGVDALQTRIKTMRYQLTQVNVPLLAQGLGEEGATGWMEQREGQPAVVVMRGPGPAPRALYAMQQAAARAPGLRVQTLTVNENEWRLTCVLENDLPEAARATPPSTETEAPLFFARGKLWQEVVRLRVEVKDADRAIGVDVERLQHRRWEADILEARLRGRSRLRQLPLLVDVLFGGQAPAARAVKVTFDGEHVEGDADLEPGGDVTGLRAALGAGANLRPDGDRLHFSSGG